jgi:hypothetical protein
VDVDGKFAVLLLSALLVPVITDDVRRLSYLAADH